MATKKYEICGSNDWGWYIMFTGTLAECEQEYENSLGYYEEHDAVIQEA